MGWKNALLSVYSILSSFATLELARYNNAAGFDRLDWWFIIDAFCICALDIVNSKYRDKIVRENIDSARKIRKIGKKLWAGTNCEICPMWIFPCRTVDPFNFSFQAKTIYHTPCHGGNHNKRGWLVGDRSIATIDFSHPTPYRILFVSWSSSKKSFQTA